MMLCSVCEVRYVRTAEACVRCTRLMKRGIILIGISSKVTHVSGKPLRLGYWNVVSEEWVRARFIGTQLHTDLIVGRVAYLEETWWELLSLERKLIRENGEE
jgi:hypothetical protein